MHQRAIRVGLMTPSDNVLLEAELATVLAGGGPGGFTLHGSRYRVGHAPRVSARALAAQRERCVLELGDAEPDILLHVDGALSWDGDESVAEIDARIAEQLATGGLETKVRSVTGALVTLLAGRGTTAVLSPKGVQAAAEVAARLESAGVVAVPGVWPGSEEGDEQVDEIIAQARAGGAHGVLLAAAYEAPCLPLALAIGRESGVAALTPGLAAAWAVSTAAGREVPLPAALSAGTPLASGS